MCQLVAIEYRESDWPGPRALVDRVEAVAEACTVEQLAAVGVAGLFAGQVQPLRGQGRPAVLFGLRAESLAAVVGVADALGMRGYSCVWAGTTAADSRVRQLGARALVGHGMVPAFGADRQMYGASPAKVRRALRETKPESGSFCPHIWMPAPDRFDRAVDGVFVEEARRVGVDLIWAPGAGINSDDAICGARPVVIRARRDEGGHPPGRLARWASGDRLQRGRLRVEDLTERPRRWLREITGLR